MTSLWYLLELYAWVYQGCFWHCIWHNKCRLLWQAFDIYHSYVSGEARLPSSVSELKMKIHTWFEHLDGFGFGQFQCSHPPLPLDFWASSQMVNLASCIRYHKTTSINCVNEGSSKIYSSSACKVHFYWAPVINRHTQSITNCNNRRGGSTVLDKVSF